jgi:hypothetical protein
MNRRFQIEDLIVQDFNGVVFHAIDQETGLPAAVRRLFPFGVNGGGLDAAEQEAYLLAIDQISTVKHPALRAILLGGIDPVDDLPFLATEWVEGATLQSFVDKEPLSSGEAVYLITQALEVCGLLSQALGRESVWVETDLSTIIIGAAETGRGFTFWISPMKCIGKNDGQRGLEPLVTLVEHVLGWRGKAVLDQDGGGLGAWLKWLRLSATSTTLAMAREKLADSLHIARPSPPPSPVRRAVRQAERSTPPSKLKKKSNLPAILASISGLGVLALGGFALIKWNESKLGGESAALAATEAPAKKEKPTKKKKSAPVDPDPGPSSVPELDAIVKKESSSILGGPPEQKASRRAAEQKAAAAGKNGIFTIADSELIATQDGKQVSLVGTLVGFKTSKSGITRYLLFSEKAANGEVRGSIRDNNTQADLSEENLSELIGKKIKITGEVSIENNFGSKRPNVVIEKRASIELQ